MGPLISGTYPLPPADRQEILRYAGAKQADSALLSLLEEALQEAGSILTPRYCMRSVPVSAEDGSLDFGFCRIRSEALARVLSGCSEAVVFAATLGIGMDRLILRYGHISPAKALLMQAIGAERIEALCDCVCQELRQKAAAEGYRTTSRFSPGYSDLPLTAQRDIFRLLDCPRTVGLSLNESLLMSPGKSVTAIVGIGSGCHMPQDHNCARCEKTDCIYRRPL